jgi:hypothetical protein
MAENYNVYIVMEWLISSILWLLVSIIEINIITFQCIRLHNYAYALHLAMPGRADNEYIKKHTQNWLDTSKEATLKVNTERTKHVFNVGQSV